MEISNANYQAMSSHPLDEVLNGCPKTQVQQEKKPRPHPEQALKCPRCDSTNTKFCYYNNYSLSQPRYFCKGCRRYWTQGGSLRNVPVGGGCRKNNKRSSSSKRAPDQALTPNSTPLLPYDHNDLTLAFARLHNQPTAMQLGLQDDHHDPFLVSSNPSYIQPGDPGFLDFLRSGLLSTTNPSGFQNLYYGFGGPGGCVEEMEMEMEMEVEGGVGAQEVMMLPTEQGMDGATATSTPTTTSTSQGSCKLMDGEESKLMMGVQWQLAGDHGNINNNIAFDSGRDLWTGFGSPWHGLMNSTPSSLL